MRLASTLKTVSLTSDPGYIEDGAIYFNSVEQCLKLSYQGTWVKLINELNLEISYLKEIDLLPIDEPASTWVILSSQQNAIILANSASSLSLVVPNNLSEHIDIGSIITVVRSGPGTVSFIPEDGVTLRSPDENYLTSQWKTIDLIKINTDEWVLDGEFPDIY